MRPVLRSASTMRPKPTGRRSCGASASSPCPPWCRAGIGRARCRWSPACAAVPAMPARSPWLRACYAQSAPSCLLLDAWYMRGSLIRTALRLGHEVIGQAIPPCSRCHHRASPEGAAGSMARALMPMWLQHCPPRSTPSPAMAGPAAPCRVSPALPQGRHRPWCELAKGSGWTKVRLLLSTDPTLSAPAIVEAYSGRWTIEPMFSDFKSRGFGVEDTQLRYADRLDRLILVMSLAVYVAVSTGQWDAVHHATPSEKKVPAISPGKSPEAEPPGSPEGSAASSS